MDQKLIVQTLKSACGNKSFRFQVIISNSKLHIYINHKTDTHPGHAFLTKLVVQAIAPLPLTEFRGMWLYSRKLGETEPNWQTYIEFPLELEVNENEMDTIGNSNTLSTSKEVDVSDVSKVSSKNNIDLLKNPSLFHENARNQGNINTFEMLVDEKEEIEDLGDLEDLEDLYDYELAEFSSNNNNNSSGDTGLLNDTGMIHKAALNEEEINTFVGNLSDEEDRAIEDLYNDNDFELAEFSDNSDSSGDTGLLNDTGMIHKAALEEEEINTFVGNLLDENSLGSDIAEPDNNNVLNSAEDSIDNSHQLKLAQYCFVSNKKILTGDIIPPDKETIRLVKLFHHLSDSNKEKILPVLDDYFKLAKIPNTEDLSLAVQKWFKQITELDDDHRHTAEIWLSRYCFDSNVTLEEFKAATIKSEAIATEKKKSYDVEHSFPSTNPNQENASVSHSVNELESSRFSIVSVVQQYILPVVWTMVTIFMIYLGLNTNKSFVGSQNIPSLCNSTIGSQEYCHFGVNLAGERQIKQLTPSAFPISPLTEEKAMRGCQRYANLKASIVDVDPLKNPVLSSYGQKIFPHIYVVKASQKSIKNNQEIKVGCVYTNGNGERSPILVKADVIPADITTKQILTLPIKSHITFGKYTNAINLGLFTIFTAIGLAIAAQLKLGIRIKHLQTIYLVALAVAIVQSLVSFLGINLLALTTLPVITMLALSWIIKDFKLNRNFGYSLLAVGFGVVIATQFLLYGLFQILINSLITYPSVIRFISIW